MNARYINNFFSKLKQQQSFIDPIQKYILYVTINYTFKEKKTNRIRKYNSESRG